ncbi:HSF2B protein, partial [Amia calva]|nr:HSF2B protein [Amia calva]
MQVREFLPKVLNVELFEMLNKLSVSEANLQSDLNQTFSQSSYVCVLECELTKCAGLYLQEKLVLKEHLYEAREQLQQQAEYCTQMGAAVCTLLWSTSSKEEAVKDILSSSRAETFFTVSGQTLQSFVNSLEDYVRPEQQDLSSDDNQFVLALAGVITNIAAVASGRDFLSSSSQVLLDTMMQLLGEMKPGVCSKLKVLMLMTLYNVSINVKGLKYISDSPGLIPLLWSLLQDPDLEVCLHTLRLLQSLVLEEEVLSKVATELQETLPLKRIQELAASRHSTVRKAAREMLDDMGALQTQSSGTHH